MILYTWTRSIYSFQIAGRWHVDYFNIPLFLTWSNCRRPLMPKLLPENKLKLLPENKRKPLQRKVLQRGARRNKLFSYFPKQMLFNSFNPLHCSKTLFCADIMVYYRFFFVGNSSYGFVALESMSSVGVNASTSISSPRVVEISGGYQ